MMTTKLPEHLAIIMDGNGRWAQSRNHSRIYGHVRGASIAKKIIIAATKLKIKNLTLFAFSTENWFRPQTEVRFLMRLLLRQILRERTTLMKNNIRFHAIGDLSRLPPAVREAVIGTIELTQGNTGMNLIFALNYGGRQEIVQAARALAQKVKLGEMQSEKIDAAAFASQLESSFLPDPDLILRTSGEQRLSNFFLWSAAYSEIYILEKLWPDFTEEDLTAALHRYANSDRRFGRLSSALNEKESFQGL